MPSRTFCLKHTALPSFLFLDNSEYDEKNMAFDFYTRKRFRFSQKTDNNTETDLLEYGQSLQQTTREAKCTVHIRLRTNNVENALARVLAVRQCSVLLEVLTSTKGYIYYFSLFLSKPQPLLKVILKTDCILLDFEGKLQAKTVQVLIPGGAWKIITMGGAIFTFLP